MPSPFRIPIPRKGVNRNFAWSDQNGIQQGFGSQLLPETTWNALNVIPYDLAGRLRPGQRPGTVRIFSALNGGTPINALGTDSIALDPNSAPAANIVMDEVWSEYTSGVSLNTTGNWNVYLGSSLNNNDYLVNSSSSPAFLDHIQADSTSPVVVWAGTPFSLALGATYQIDVTFTWAGADTSQSNYNIFLRAAAGHIASGTSIEVNLMTTNTASPTTTTTIGVGVTGGSYDSSASVTGFNPTQGQTFVLSVLVQGNNISVLLNGTQILAPFSETIVPSNSGFGFSINNNSGGSTPSCPHAKVNEFKLSTASAAAYRQTYLVAMTEGNIYSGNLNAVALASGGSNIVPAGVQPSLSFGDGNCYVAGGTIPTVLALSSNTATPLNALIGVPQPAALTQSVAGSLAAGNEFYKLTFVTATGETTPSTEASISRSANNVTTVIAPVASSPSVTGYNVYASTTTGTEKLQNVTPLALTANWVEPTSGLTNTGASPPSTNTATAGAVPQSCLITAVWRDRLVFAAPPSNPSNFFFSRVGVHTDYDYSQSDAAAAFAGNASTAGHIGDPITALLPFNDDVMLIGGDHHLWRVTGDPAQNGTIDLVSDAIGVFSNTSWTKDPVGNIYFVGTGGLYMISPNGQPQNLSKDVFNQFFAGINRANDYVTLVWDRDNQGMHIFVTPIIGGAGVHLWYDARNQGFWQFQFPATHGPLSAVLYDDSNPNNRLVLMGGTTGLIQKITPGSLNDDGAIINSFLVLGPFQPAAPAGDAVVSMMDVTLVETEGENGLLLTTNVNWTLTGGRYAEEAVGPAPRATAGGTFTYGGVQLSKRQRIRGGWFALTLSNSTINTYWGMEHAILHVEGQGKQR